MSDSKKETLALMIPTALMIVSTIGLLVFGLLDLAEPDGLSVECYKSECQATTHKRIWPYIDAYKVRDQDD